ncbi:protein-glutamine gamma-glutamyltransferase K-like protein, partial [Leptotrombidium deliense]
TSQGIYNIYIPSKSKTSWEAKFKLRANVIDVAIKLPANVPVGFWNLNIYTYRQNLQQFKVYQVRDILILFNPWSPYDSVYYPRANELNEYVMNEEGYVITGDQSASDKKYWIYGQVIKYFNFKVYNFT